MQTGRILSRDASARSSYIRPMLKEFREFIARGNVIDLAVGVIIGAAFGKIVTTLVEGIIMPPIGLLLGRIDFSSLFYALDGTQPASLAKAKELGTPVIAYGQFINDVIGFIIVALAVFLLVKQVNRIKRPSARGCATDARLSVLCVGDFSPRDALPQLHVSTVTRERSGGRGACRIADLSRRAWWHSP